MTTATTIITDALQDLGALSAGQSPTSDDLADALRRLNKLVASWSLDNLMVPYRTQISHVLNGSESYTIGTGGDINTTRPLAIESAFVEHNDTDYPMRVSRDRSEYDRIDEKDITGIPRFVYYEPSVPLGRLFVWYVGDANYTLKLNTRGQLTAFPDATTDVDLAPGYDLAMETNLAIILAGAYEASVSAETAKTAKDSLSRIRRLNRQEPVMSYPGGIPSSGRRSRFNIEAGY